MTGYEGAGYTVYLTKMSLRNFRVEFDHIITKSQMTRMT